MAAGPPGPSPGPDPRATPSAPPKQRGGFRFEWIASSPSPAEVLALERSFPEVVEVPRLRLEATTEDWAARAVVARCLSRWIPPEAIVREFGRAGIPGEVEAVSLAHRCYFFRFRDAEARNLVLSDPWVINGQPLAIEEWRPQFRPAADAVTKALLWIRLPGLPIEFWDREALEAISSVAGEFSRADPCTLARSRGGFARVAVRVDLRFPLRPGARISGLGAPFWQHFAYEHVEGICGSCGTLHLAGQCSSVQPAKGNEDGWSYGPWMAALRQRIPASGMAGERRQKSVSGGLGSGPQRHVQPPVPVDHHRCRRRRRRAGRSRSSWLGVDLLRSSQPQWGAVNRKLCLEGFEGRG